MQRSPGLRFTFIVALVGFTALMSLAFAGLSAYRVSRDLREQLVHRGEGLTANLAQEAVRFLSIEDPLERELSLMLLTYRVIGDVIYAQVVHEGALVSESSLESQAAPQLLRDLPGAALMREVSGEGTPYLDFVRALPGEGQRSYVRIGLSLAEVREKLRQNLRATAGLSLLFTLIGAAVAFGLYSAILKPLERLAGSIGRLAAGDLTARAPLAKYRELRDLGEAFNRMAATISRRSRELEEVNTELRSANEAKSEFLAMIGHELKTPLHSVRGYCQLLLEELDGPLTPEQRADVEAVLTSGNHLLSLIGNILNFSASGSEALHVTRVDLQELLEQSVHYVRPLAQRKRLRLVVNVGEAGSVEADRTKLKQVFINLLENAVKYTDRGEVRLSAGSGQGAVTIDVTDSGPGVPLEQRDKVFEPFERLTHADDDLQGLGLGLAIVRRYVEAHGGSVTLSEALGGGSHFRVVLPRRVQGEQPQVS